ncbi:MAG: hypothetical protein ACUVTU_11125 [Desulfurispora sp.]|uniref:hypothetical protein n=1 Tax=Desulfurispora sp. TaxID=3014275 RepID=UPI00404AA887
MKSIFSSLTDGQASGWFREHVLQILEMPLAELEQNPHWLRLLGLFVELPGMLEDKLRVLATVADLSPRSLEIRLERCPERDEVVRLLGERGQQWVLLALLTASLTRCLPETRTPADLQWLLTTLLAVKSAGSQTAALRLQPHDGPRLTVVSPAYWQALCAEAVLAAARAWYRFLRGPGGTNVCRDAAFVFADRELAAEILDLLAEDPLVLALFVQELAGRPGFPTRQELEPWLERARAAVRFIQQQLDTAESGPS